MYGGESDVPLQSVAERIIARYLRRGLGSDAEIVSGSVMQAARGIDIIHALDGVRRTIKVKAAPYFGTDQAKIGDRSLVFYRADTGSFAFEAVADAATREPGWIVDSEADDLYYYYLALAQREGEIRALLREPDDVFFAELAVDRDDLTVLPMVATRRWFTSHAEDYTPRPVSLGDRSAWCRLASRADVRASVECARIIGPVFPALVG